MYTYSSSSPRIWTISWCPPAELVTKNFELLRMNLVVASKLMTLSYESLWDPVAFSLPGRFSAYKPHQF